MRLFDLCRSVGESCPEHLKNAPIEGISSRSSEVKKNYLFVAIRGTKRDGHRFIGEATERGASAVIIDNPDFASDITVRVDDSRGALSRMASALSEDPAKKMRMIGVTGTNGKTSVSAMIKNIFDTAKIPCGIIGTLDGEQVGEASLTTPDPEALYPRLAGLCESGVRTAVMEASSHALALGKLEPISFEIGIFTNLTEDHLDFHGNRENYFLTKRRLLERSRLGIVNIDDEYGARLAADAPCKIKTCSLTGAADYSAYNLTDRGLFGGEMTVSSPRGDIRVACSVPGEFNLSNALLAAAAASELGIPSDVTERAFRSFRGVRGRMERTEYGDGTSVIIDYAHTPDALSKTVEAIGKNLPENAKIITVFGCGGDREREKRPLMGEIAAAHSDLAVITSDNPRTEPVNRILFDIAAGLGERTNYVLIPDRGAAIEYAFLRSCPGDVILLAGKGHENYEIGPHGKIPFDEREVAARAYEKYKSKGK